MKKEALLAKCRAVSERAAQTRRIGERNHWLLDIALDHLTLGRAALYAAILESRTPAIPPARPRRSPAPHRQTRLPAPEGRARRRRIRPQAFRRRVVLHQVVIRAAIIPTVTTIDDRSDRVLSLGKDAPEPRPVRTPHCLKSASSATFHPRRLTVPVCNDADSVYGTSTIPDAIRGCATATTTPRPALYPGMPARSGRMTAWRGTTRESVVIWRQRTTTMTRMAAEILELTERIESLGTKQKVKLLERVMTPEMELRFAMEQMARRARHVPSRVLDRAADRAIREVRRERATRSKH